MELNGAASRGNGDGGVDRNHQVVSPNGPTNQLGDLLPQGTLTEAGMAGEGTVSNHGSSQFAPLSVGAQSAAPSSRSCDSTTVNSDQKSSSENEEYEGDNDGEESRTSNNKRKKIDRSKLRKGKWTVRQSRNVVTDRLEELHRILNIAYSFVLGYNTDRRRGVHIPHHSFL